MPPTHRVAHQGKQADRYALEYQRRGTRQSRGYTNAWLAAAEDFKKRHPLCRLCEEAGRVSPAQCVDHTVPHEGNSLLFWDEDNWQSLCNPCHAGPKRIAENAARRARQAKLPGRGRPPSR
jgi:5-methylcytosine-specific restriction protein A